MYHLIKKSRSYNGRAYCGATSQNVPAEFEQLTEARKAVTEFTERNIVGWDIYDSSTKELIE